MPLQLYRTAIIFALAAGLGVGAALAAPAPAASPRSAQPMDALYACMDTKEDAARLACFDRETGKLRAAESAGSFKAIDRQSVEQLQKESFGFQLPSLPRLALPKFGAASEAPEEQTYEIAAVRSGQQTAYVMTDGSVWRQIETERNTHVKKGATVVIEKGALGSFMLSPTKGGGRGLRVRREQ
jgi:hypothetical protein